MSATDEGCRTKTAPPELFSEWDRAPTATGWYWRISDDPRHWSMLAADMVAYDGRAFPMGWLWHGPLVPPALPGRLR